MGGDDGRLSCGGCDRSIVGASTSIIIVHYVMIIYFIIIFYHK